MTDRVTGKMVGFFSIVKLLIAAVICWASTVAVMAADDVVPKPAEAAQSILPDAMRQNCREASNSCQVCVILPPSGIVHCSLPGIACQPRAWLCRAPVVKRDDSVGADK